MIEYKNKEKERRISLLKKEEERNREERTLKAWMKLPLYIHATELNQRCHAMDFNSILILTLVMILTLVLVIMSITQTQVSIVDVKYQVLCSCRNWFDYIFLVRSFHFVSSPTVPTMVEIHDSNELSIFLSYSFVSCLNDCCKNTN